MTTLRLQKYMSECGICSRRHAEEAIARGDVIVNGVVAQTGLSIDPEVDVVEYSGQMVKRSEQRVYYAMHKPRGIETTCAQKGGESIVDIIDSPVRVFPIGRLDKDSSGLILLTNDGRITHRLLHPSFEHEKEYLVTVYGKIPDTAIEALGGGVRYAITE
jgi:23S rRNA pseudouridine2605 synthase/23S rRNA pseudouridine2604 synthase